MRYLCSSANWKFAPQQTDGTTKLHSSLPLVTFLSFTKKRNVSRALNFEAWRGNMLQVIQAHTGRRPLACMHQDQQVMTPSRRANSKVGKVLQNRHAGMNVCLPVVATRNLPRAWVSESFSRTEGERRRWKASQPRRRTLPREMRAKFLAFPVSVPCHRGLPGLY